MARARVVRFDSETFRRNARQQEYMAKAGTRLRAERSRRRKELVDHRPAIERAVAAYRSIDQGERPHIVLRDTFVRLGRQRPARDAEPDEPVEPTNDDAAEPSTPASTAAQREVRTRPPLTQLIHRQTNALRLLLTGIYVAHIEKQPRRHFTNQHGIAAAPPNRRPYSWATLCGLADGNVRARRARVTRALDELARHQLVRLGESRQRYEDFQLLQEDGSERPYRPPTISGLWLPPALFYYGWHLVLTPAEMATYLIVRDAIHEHDGRARPGGVAIPEVVRYSTYGLSDEVYSSIHELQEFGLIEIIDPMPNRRRGKVRPAAAKPDQDPDEAGLSPVPYRFALRKDGLNRNALTVVDKCLGASPLPPRLID